MEHATGEAHYYYDTTWYICSSLVIGLDSSLDPLFISFSYYFFFSSASSLLGFFSFPVPPPWNRSSYFLFSFSALPKSGYVSSPERNRDWCNKSCQISRSGGDQ